MKKIKVLAMTVVVGIELMFCQTKISGAIDGSGTARYIPMFEDSDTLADSPVSVSSGNKIFIGSPIDTAELKVMGPAEIYGLNSSYGLKVRGTIHSSVGGFMFPDGSIQATAATNGGGGTIYGSGTLNYIPIFDDSDTLTDSPIRVTDELILIEGTRRWLIEGSIAILGRNSKYGLDINGPIRSQSGGITFPDNTIQETAANNWRVYSSNMYSLPSGNVGIGTTAPETKLEVQGGAIKATGGLIIETRTTDPSNPETGQIWLRTDL